MKMADKKFPCQVISINVEGVLEHIQVTCRVKDACIKVNIENGVLSEDYIIDAEDIDKVACFVKNNEQEFQKEVWKALRINTWNLLRPFGECLEVYQGMYILILTHNISKSVIDFLLRGNIDYAKIELQKEEAHDLIQGVVLRSRLSCLDQGRKFSVGADVYTVKQTN